MSLRRQANAHIWRTRMACQISFKHSFVQLNNMQFSRLIDFGIEIANRSSSDEERQFVERMKRLCDSFWPGRGIKIEDDFPELPERKFWSRIFFDTSRAI